MNIGCLHLLVMGWGVMLCIIFYLILGSRPPVNDELDLFGSILNPKKLHVNGLGPFLFDGAIGKSDGKGVAGLHGIRRLWMTHFLESLLDRNGFRTIYL